MIVQECKTANENIEEKKTRETRVALSVYLTTLAENMVHVFI